MITDGPFNVFNLFCFSQAMRFPPKSYNKDLESIEVSLCLKSDLAVLLSP